MLCPQQKDAVVMSMQRLLVLWLHQTKIEFKPCHARQACTTKAFCVARRTETGYVEPGRHRHPAIERHRPRGRRGTDEFDVVELHGGREAADVGAAASQAAAERAETE